MFGYSITDFSNLFSPNDFKCKKYCLKRKKSTENINPRVSKTSNGKRVLLSECAICGVVKNQDF